MISWHSGKFARVARSSNAAEVQAAADAEGELGYIRLSLRELVGETIPLQRWQEAAAHVPGALVFDSRGVYDALARSESACLGLKDKRSGWVQQAVRECRFALCRVAGKDNPADILTMPMSLDEMRGKLRGIGAIVHARGELERRRWADYSLS